jgi:ankyrin repeat protein
MNGMQLFHAACDGDTRTVATLLSTAGAQSFINYQQAASGATPLHQQAASGATPLPQKGMRP